MLVLWQSHMLFKWRGFHLDSLFCVVFYNVWFVQNIFLQLCEMLRLHIVADTLTKSGINRILEFCSQSRFRMLSYSSSATQTGYRACGGRAKVINIKWIPQQPFTRRRRRQFERRKRGRKRVKCNTALLQEGMREHRRMHTPTSLSASTCSGPHITAEWWEEPSFQ